MTKPAFSPEVREQMAGWRVLTAYQVPQNDGRKLTRCAIPSDPWNLVLHNGGSSVLFATRHLHGRGDTLDAAALAALSTLGTDLRGAMMRLEDAVTDLAAIYRG